MIRTTSRVDQRYDGAGPGRSMLAFRSVVSVLVNFVMPPISGKRRGRGW